MTTDRLSTGVGGLDRILDGGLVSGQNVLLRGPPGSGKTIFGLHFLGAGMEAGETSLYINLGEPSRYVRETAEAFDLHPEDITFYDLSPSGDQFNESESYSLFHASEVEQPGLVGDLRETVEELAPDRVFLDPITEFRYLTADEHQFRTQVLSFLDFLKEMDATVLLTSQASEMLSDDDLQFLTDTVISLDITEDDRTVQVSKFRGSSFQRGGHSYEITGDGVEVWPRLVPSAGTPDRKYGKLSSGVPELDQLLNGGLDEGTMTFLSGPTGAGKTTTGIQFLKEAVAQGKHCVLFQFEEATRTLLKRSEAVNIPITDMVERGDLEIVEITPEAYSADQFADIVRAAVEEDGADVVMIDGIQGFNQNLRGLDDDPAYNILRIGRYLRSKGVSAIINNEVHNITGEFRVTEGRTSNLADNIIFIRHVEYRGEMRKVIGALKMRTSDFERTLRELEITEYGLSVGDPLANLHGVLTGTPEWDAAPEGTGADDA